VRRYYSLVIIVSLGCSGQESSEPLGATASSTVDTEEALPFAPAPIELEVNRAIPRDMDVLSGTLKSDTSVLVSIDASSTVDDMIQAIEDENLRVLAQYETMGWTMSVTAGTRFLALHADDYPYIRIQLESGNFEKRRGYIHKKYLDFNENGFTLRYFTSERGRGKAWRSR